MALTTCVQKRTHREMVEQAKSIFVPSRLTASPSPEWRCNSSSTVICAPSIPTLDSIPYSSCRNESTPPQSDTTSSRSRRNNQHSDLSAANARERTRIRAFHSRLFASIRGLGFLSPKTFCTLPLTLLIGMGTPLYDGKS